MENVANLERQHGDVLEQWESIVRRAGYVAGHCADGLSLSVCLHFWHLR